ncbi:MAG: hypothetical protein KTR16_08855 [Acidiferrobacterales bacterium]|nr:hypothetical protein [Acidiferrobacterales bacterium]
MNTQSLKKTLLVSALSSLFVLNAANALEATEKNAERMYTDPVTGEVKYAKKLLSEMTDTEKALLSNEEYRALKELEAKLKKEQAGDTVEPKGNGE